MYHETIDTTHDASPDILYWRVPHNKFFVSMTRKSVIYYLKQNCGPFCYETPDSFGSEFLNITYPHPPRLST